MTRTSAILVLLAEESSASRCARTEMAEQPLRSAGPAALVGRSPQRERSGPDPRGPLVTWARYRLGGRLRAGALGALPGPRPPDGRLVGEAISGLRELQTRQVFLQSFRHWKEGAESRPAGQGRLDYRNCLRGSICKCFFVRLAPRYPATFFTVG